MRFSGFHGKRGLGTGAYKIDSAVRHPGRTGDDDDFDEFVAEAFDDDFSAEPKVAAKDDWVSPYPSNPMESVRVLKRGEAPSPDAVKEAPYSFARDGAAQYAAEQGMGYGNDAAYEPYSPYAPYPEDGGSWRFYAESDRTPGVGQMSLEFDDGIYSMAVDANPADDLGVSQVPQGMLQAQLIESGQRQQDAKSMLSRYGGKYATFGRKNASGQASSVAKSNGNIGAEGVAKAGEGRFAQMARQAQSARGASKRRGKRRAPVDAVHEVEAIEEPVALPPARIPTRCAFSPDDLDAINNWQARFGTEAAAYRASLLASHAHHIVDAGCGVGRLAIHLAQWGFNVMALDRDSEMLARANEIASEKLDVIESAGGAVEFRQCDAGGFSGMLGMGVAEGVLCAGNSITGLANLDELRRMLADCNALLASDGAIVISCVNYRKLAYERRRSAPPVLAETERGLRLFLELYDYPAGGTYVDTTTLMGTQGDDGQWQMESVVKRHLILTADTLSRELIDAGFDVVENLGSFDGAPASPLESEIVYISGRRRRSVVSQTRH